MAAEAPADEAGARAIRGRRGSPARRRGLLLLELLPLALLGATGSWLLVSGGGPRLAGLLLVLVALLLLARTLRAAQVTARLARVARERERVEGVVQSAAMIAADNRLDTLLPRIAALAAQTVDREIASVIVWTEDASGTDRRVVHGRTPAQVDLARARHDRPTGDLPVEVRVRATRRPAIMRIDDPDLSDVTRGWLQAIGIIEALIAPLVAHDRVLGTIALWTAGDDRPFEPIDLETSAAIGQQAGLAIHNARLLERARRHANEQAILLRVSRAAISNLALPAMLAEVTRASLGLEGAESCSIELWHPDEDATEVMANADVADWSEPVEIGSRFPLADWPSTSRVLNERVSLNLLTDDPRLTAAERQGFEEAGTRALLVVPLIVADRAIGIMSFFTRARRRFAEDDARLAEEIAAHVALAIDRALLTEQLRRLADTDGLTGVLNHRAILAAFDRELVRRKRTGRPLSVLMIDINGFKQVNDTWGHLAGDDVLREVAALVRSTLREVDALGRYGGDEFLAVLPETDAAGAGAAIARLRDRLDAQRPAVDGTPLPIDLAVGFAVAPDDALERSALLATADTRMYAAKEWSRRAGRQRGPSSKAG